jgi:signal transduction histidine kinase
MQTAELARLGGRERKRVEAVVETLATLGSRGESVAEVAHDARNMVTALGLYCDLLEEPGVLANPFAHYGSELRLVAAASRRLVEKLVALDTDSSTNAGAIHRAYPDSTYNRPGRIRGENNGHHSSSRWDLLPELPMANLAAELLANHNLLAALAGPAITLTVDVEGGARPVRMTGEDLTRVMVNLVKNAAEAMPAGGRIQIELRELPAAAGAVEGLVLTVEDSGPGIPEEALEPVFALGYSTRTAATEARASWAAAHRGLGLSITRSVVEASGGRIFAARRAGSGACFRIELPVRIASR